MKAEAASLGVGVQGSELVGLVPKRALVAAGEHYLDIEPGTEPDEGRIFEAAVDGLGLNVSAPFDPKSRILEYAFAARRELSNVFSIKSFL